jgi:hypothetical protein
MQVSSVAKYMPSDRGVRNRFPWAILQQESLQDTRVLNHLQIFPDAKYVVRVTSWRSKPLIVS